MVQVITNLGGSASFNAMAVIRPIFVSLAFALAVPIFCHFAVVPLTRRLADQKMMPRNSMLLRLLGTQQWVFVIHTAILVGMITGASYAGTSSLFAAYLSGAAISWWDTEVPHSSSCVTEEKPPKSNAVSGGGINSNPKSQNPDDQIMAAPSVTLNKDQNVKQSASGQVASSSSKDGVRLHGDRRRMTNGVDIFDKYYRQVLDRILKPFFFASIGFSVPITRMFAGSVVWRGLIYTAIMVLAKIFCGLWLMQLKIPGLPSPFSKGKKSHPKKNNTPELPPSSTVDSEIDRPETELKAKSATQQANISAKLGRSSKHSHQTSKAAKPVSIYPGAIVGCAMVARGEIGFLISSLAEMNGIFGEAANGQLFLTVTWAIILCTIVGPCFVGILVRRLKLLSERKERGGGRNVLGVWGLAG